MDQGPDSYVAFVPGRALKLSLGVVDAGHMQIAYVAYKHLDVP